MSTFSKGEMVKATVAAQGLRAGETYKVVAISERPTPFGSFFEYTLASLRPEEPGFEWTICNAHFILDRVEPAKAQELEDALTIARAKKSELQNLRIK